MRKRKHFVKVELTFETQRLDKGAVQQVQEMLDTWMRAHPMQHVVTRALAKSTVARGLPPVCSTCGRDTKVPLFDGCMQEHCPRGYKPCL